MSFVLDCQIITTLVLDSVAGDAPLQAELFGPDPLAQSLIALVHKCPHMPFAHPCGILVTLCPGQRLWRIGHPRGLGHHRPDEALQASAKKQHSKQRNRQLLHDECCFHRHCLFVQGPVQMAASSCISQMIISPGRPPDLPGTISTRQGPFRYSRSGRHRHRCDNQHIWYSLYPHSDPPHVCHS